MKLLLDECIPRKLRKSLAGHECGTVAEQGWRGKKNGDLLLLAENAGFDVFLSVDRGIEFQQRLHSRRLAILVIRTQTNRLADLLPLVPEVLERLRRVRHGQVIMVG